MNVGLAAVVTATASPTPIGPATAAVTALQVVTLVIALLGLIVSVVALTILRRFAPRRSLHIGQ
jgi:hypothetical protein